MLLFMQLALVVVNVSPWVIVILDISCTCYSWYCLKYSEYFYFKNLDKTLFFLLYMKFNWHKQLNQQLLRAWVASVRSFLWLINLQRKWPILSTCRWPILETISDSKARSQHCCSGKRWRLPHSSKRWSLGCHVKWGRMQSCPATDPSVVQE